MANIKHIVLDVLKPHHPNALEFAAAIADGGAGYHVRITVHEVDEKTETVVVTIDGDDLQFDAIVDKIANMGASVHSIDEVEVVGATPEKKDTP